MGLLDDIAKGVEDALTKGVEEIFDSPEESKKKKKKKMRYSLTSAMKKRLIAVVNNKCEIKGCKNDVYHIHHIKSLSNGGTNIGSNLVMICANHHSDAHKGKITQVELKDVIQNRTSKKRSAINLILKDRTKVGKEVSKKKSDW